MAFLSLWWCEFANVFICRHPDAGEDVHKYVVAVGLFAAGNSLWSSTSPRYNQHREMYKGGLARNDSEVTEDDDDESSDLFV